jgi:transposase
MVKKYRQHLLVFFLRHGQSYPGKSHWTKMHIEWIRELTFDHRPHYILIKENLAAIRDSR